MNDFQAIGSGYTYFRRYCISSILGLVTDKDTDAAGTQVVKQVPAKPSPKAEVKLELNEFQEIQEVINGTGTIAQLTSLWLDLEDYYKEIQVVKDLFSNRKNQLNK